MSVRFAAILGPASEDALAAILPRLGADDDDAALGVWFDEGVALGAVADRPFGADVARHAELCAVGDVWLRDAVTERRRLEQDGARFEGESHLEVVLHAYRQRGVDCLARLSGRFAFALWDGQRRRLFVARDRMGLAQVLWWPRPGGGIVCSSRLKGILGAPDLESPRLDGGSLDDLLTLGAVPAPRTLVRGVSALSPGHLIVAGRDDAPTVDRYHRLPASGAGPIPTGGVPAAVARLRDALERSVAARMDRSDGLGVGLLLSGGLSSATVGAMASTRQGTKLACFAWGFDGRRDALPSAALAVRSIGGAIGRVMLGEDDLVELPALMDAVEQPLTSLSAIGLWSLLGQCRRVVPVMLTGFGAEAMFGSAPAYRAIDRFARAGDRLTKALTVVLERLPSAWLSPLGPFPGTIADAVSRKRLLSALAADGAAERWEILGHVFARELRQQLYTPELREEIAAAPGAAADLRAALSPGPHPEEMLDRLIDLDVRQLLPAGLLSITERIASARGLALRHPLLDDEVVRAILPLPRSYKLGGPAPTDRRILRRVAGELLPRTLAIRPREEPRVPPSAFGRSWRLLLAGVLQPDRIDDRGLFRTRAVRDLVLATRQAPVEAEQQLFTLATVELWLERFGVAL